MLGVMAVPRPWVDGFAYPSKVTRQRRRGFYRAFDALAIIFVASFTVLSAFDGPGLRWFEVALVAVSTLWLMALCREVYENWMIERTAKPSTDPTETPTP